MGALVGLLLAACAPVRGVVVAADPPVVQDLRGRRTRLVGGEVLGRLPGYGVEVRGPRLLGRQRVRSWRVLTAPDGSMPYVGPLVRRGLQLVVLDRNSGMEVALDAGAVPGLADHEGELVLVVGYVVGPWRVRAVGFVPLGPPPSRGAGPRLSGGPPVG